MQEAKMRCWNLQENVHKKKNRLKNNAGDESHEAYNLNNMYMSKEVLIEQL